MRRRDLLLAAAALVAAGCGGAKKTRPRPKPTPPEGFTRVTRAADLNADTWTRTFARFPPPYDDQFVHLRLDEDGEPLALSERCTHLGCPVRWVDGARKFICPCHGAVFGEQGRPAGGPAKLPLVRFEARTVAGAVYVKPRPAIVSELTG